MNRHDRRARAARDRRTGYLHRMLAASQSGLLQRGTVSIANIAHDAWCNFYQGGERNCVPDIDIVGSNSVVTVDEQGRASRQAKS